MSFTIEDNLNINYEKALDEGRNVLVKVCIVLLKGATVASYFTALSNTHKKNWGFTPEQISQIEAGRPLNKMDITLLHLIIRALKLVGPGHLQDLLKKFKVERNHFAHEKQNLSLDKTKLGIKLAELEVLYTAIFEELKTHCDPAVIPSLDKDIADMGARLLTLEKTVGDGIHEETKALREETTLTVAKISQSSATLEQNNHKTMTNLNQAASQIEGNLKDIVSKTKSDLDLTTANLNLQVTDSTDTLKQGALSVNQILNQAAITALQVEKTLKRVKDIEICENQIQSMHGQHSQPQHHHQLQQFQIQQQHDRQQQQPDLLIPSQRKNNSLSSFILITHKYKLGKVSPIVIIKESAEIDGSNADYNFSTVSSMWVCELYIRGILVASAGGKSKKLAKEATATQALASLKSRCHTLQVLKQHIGEESITVDCVSGVASNDPCPQDNFGITLLKMMGCSSGSYSDNGKETAEPIRLESVNGSQGLDMKAAVGVTDQFKQSIHTIIQDYVATDQQEDLIFSPDFTKDQRAEIRLIAHYMNLKGLSTGSGNNRFLVISGKDKFDKSNAIQEVFKMGETEKYKLLKPGEPWDNDE